MTFFVNDTHLQPCEDHTEHLNHQCHCLLNREALRAELPDAELVRLLDEREHLFSDAVVFVAETTVQQQLAIIAAIEKVIALPAYQQHVLTHAPEAALFVPKARGVFFGYDFHLTATQKPQLIEINSNAGGALVNALLLRSQTVCCIETDAAQCLETSFAETDAAQDLETVFMDMFLCEWRAERGGQPLRRLAIVDEDPLTQYMLPEFLLFQHLARRHHIDAVICDPGELAHHDGKLWHQGQVIDLVYNRLTDFSLEQSRQQALRTAYLANDVVLTPHPRAHALYANKKNLALLTDDSMLQALGVDADTRATLCDGIAHTECVKPEQAGELWANRKNLFFKPAKGYGSKATYRGDKLTKRVFDDIMHGDYVAQHLVQPSDRQLCVAGQLIHFKLDLRHYVYQGHSQLLSARLYQGQTTNFRTPHGGFARVVVVACA